MHVGLRAQYIHHTVDGLLAKATILSYMQC